MAIGYLILGIGLLTAGLLFARWVTVTNPATLARVLKWTVMILLGLFIGFLLLAGRAGQAFAFAGAALMLYRGLRGILFQPTVMRASQASPAPGQTSEVETEYLKMNLDHDSGSLQGRVLKGKFAGQVLDELGLDSLLILFEDVLKNDEKSAQLLETYLDRSTHSDWRYKFESREKSHDAKGKIQMAREEAREILGVKDNATAEEIKAAHRRLMSINHPDHGGSSYLAARINLAKEVLLNI